MTLRINPRDLDTSGERAKLKPPKRRIDASRVVGQKKQAEREAAKWLAKSKPKEAK